MEKAKLGLLLLDAMSDDVTPPPTSSSSDVVDVDEDEATLLIGDEEGELRSSTTAAIVVDTQSRMRVHADVLLSHTASSCLSARLAGSLITSDTVLARPWALRHLSCVREQSSSDEDRVFDSQWTLAVNEEEH